MNKYIVIEASTAKQIGTEVSKRLNVDGWFLVGGLSVSVLPAADKEHQLIRYSQAMVYDERQLEKVIASQAVKKTRAQNRYARPVPPEPAPPSQES